MDFLNQGKQLQTLQSPELLPYDCFLIYLEMVKYVHANCWCSMTLETCPVPEQCNNPHIQCSEELWHNTTWLCAIKLVSSFSDHIDRFSLWRSVSNLVFPEFPITTVTESLQLAAGHSHCLFSSTFFSMRVFQKGKPLVLFICSANLHGCST